MVAIRQSDLDFIATQLVSETIERQGNALIEAVAGTEQLKKVALQYINCAPELTQGRMFEILEVTKFNISAAKGGELLRAVTTDHLGYPHAAADILIRNSQGDILKEIQAKSSISEATLTRSIAKEHYEGMDRLVNSDKVSRVEELLEKRISKQGIYAEDYKAAKEHLQGELKYGNSSSGGTEYSEAIDAAKNPEQVAKHLNYEELFSGLSSAMVSGALAGAFLGGTVHGIQTTYSKEFCVKETSKAALNSAARSSVISGVAYGLKYVGKDNPIMNGNVVASLASSAVNISELTYKYLRNQISTEEYLLGLGSNSVSCFSGIVMTAAGAALFGPIGAAIAGPVALIGMKQLYKVFVTSQKDLQLSIEQRKKAEELSTILIKEIRQQEKGLLSYYKEYEETLAELETIVDLAIQDDSFTESALTAIAIKLNIEFKYPTLESFSDFMNSDDTLTL